eukprot:bmy_11796T0
MIRLVNYGMNSVWLAFQMPLMSKPYLTLQALVGLITVVWNGH